MTERLGAAGQDQVGPRVGDIAPRGLDRLQAGCTVALHGLRRHPLAAAEPQRGDASRVHLIRLGGDATEDHFVELFRRERLAQQQRPSGRDGKVDRRERARAAACLEEWRAAAVDYIDRATRGG